MRRKLKTILQFVTIFFLIILVLDSMIVGYNVFYQNACAPTRENSENITIPANDIASLNLAFNSGDELELIFLLNVKQELPIDVWFVNYANYVRLMDGNEFLFYIDGSDEDIITISKVVSVTQYGSYILVLANNNNETVEVFINYDINVYPIEEDTISDNSEKGDSVPLWNEFYVMFPLGLVIGIIFGLFVSRYINKSRSEALRTKESSSKKTRKPKKNYPEATTNISSRKIKTRKAKKKVPIETKKEEDQESEKEESQIIIKASEKEPKSIKKTPSSNFCGNCGTPVITPFCKNCGKKI